MDAEFLFPALVFNKAGADKSYTGHSRMNIGKNSGFPVSSLHEIIPFLTTCKNNSTAEEDHCGCFLIVPALCRRFFPSSCFGG